MSGKLTNGQRHQLEQWIGTGPKNLQLLYSFTRDGCNSQTFHTKCDNQGPTVTVLYNPSGSVYGGYTAMDWDTSNQYVSDTAAFLFRLQYNSSDTFNIFPVKSEEQGAIISTTGYGPVFGHDLYTFTGTIIPNSAGYYTLDGSQNYGSTYEMHGVTAAQINNGNTNVTELEVYTVQDAIWRKTPKWTSMLLKSLQAEIEPRFNVLLIGPVGAGKSSFVDTVASVFRDSVTDEARSGSAEQSLKSTYRMYDIRSTPGQLLNLTLCDTQGLEEAQGLDAHEVTYILSGNVPNKYTFNPSTPISEDTPGFIKKPTEREKIHCVCFIVDGTGVEVIPENVKEKMKAIQTQVNHRDIPQLVLLTKVDRICKSVQIDLSTIFSNTKVKNAVNKASQLFGIPRAQVLPVKNYESDILLDENVSILTLLALQKILRSCQDYLGAKE